MSFGQVVYTHTLTVVGDPTPANAWTRSVTRATSSLNAQITASKNGLEDRDQG
jgi:hypothetical protein